MTGGAPAGHEELHESGYSRKAGHGLGHTLIQRFCAALDIFFLSRGSSAACSGRSHVFWRQVL